MIKDAESEMVSILEKLLEGNVTISARAVVRLHSRIRHASTITRSPDRLAILNRFKEEQRQLRAKLTNFQKRSDVDSAKMMSQRDRRIEEIERQLENLVASHIFFFRWACETGGVRKLHEFYESYREFRNSLEKVQAIPPIGKTT